MKLPVLLATALLVATLGEARAQEKPVPLKPGQGRDVVEANCGSCHSLDYVPTNASFMTPKVWEVEVTKMVNAFGAPIAPADAKAIIDYLAQNYGKPG